MPRCCENCTFNGKGDICMITLSDTHGTDCRLKDCPLEEYTEPKTDKTDNRIYRYEEGEKITGLIRSCLSEIERELGRLYWNREQKELNSPLQNTGESYKCDAFEVTAYNWDENREPNFRYKDLKCWWYKHSRRGMYAESEMPVTAEYLADMLEECFKSMRKDFNEKRA